MKYEAAKVCIYCGARDVELTDEHIVPFGLGGDHVLPKSSCKPCATITGAKVEQLCLKETLINQRLLYNLPTRNKKDRAKTFTITIGEPAYRRTKELPIEQLPPYSWALPSYGWPGMLIGRTPEDCPKGNMESHLGAGGASALLVHGGGIHPVGLQMARMDLGLFERMLAKIAHSFAIATLGSHAFEPFLPALILRGVAHQTFWIGEARDLIREVDETLYDVRLGVYERPDGDHVLAAKIRIMGFIGTPHYMITVGRWKRGKRLPPGSAAARYVNMRFKDNYSASGAYPSRK